MYKAIVFDFDGTIVDTEQHLFNIINKHLISHKATPITLDFYRENIGGEAKGFTRIFGTDDWKR